MAIVSTIFVGGVLAMIMSVVVAMIIIAFSNMKKYRIVQAIKNESARRVWESNENGEKNDLIFITSSGDRGTSNYDNGWR